MALTGTLPLKNVTGTVIVSFVIMNVINVITGVTIVTFLLYLSKPNKESGAHLKPGFAS